MIGLSIDLETTGLDPEVDEVIEVGCILADLKRKKVLMSSGFLIKRVDEDWLLDRSITNLTGINDEMISAFGYTKELAIDVINQYLMKAECLVAHNAEFEKGFLQTMGVKTGDRIWIDTKYDIPYPDNCLKRDLVSVCAHHRIMNMRAHRALEDSRAMLALLFDYDFDNVLGRAKYPLVEAIAEVSYQDRNKASTHGFMWDGKTKKWFKKIKECDIDKEKESYDFAISIVSGGMR